MNARPSIFPLAGPAVRFQVTPDDTWEFLLGVYDGNPGDPDVSEHLPRSILVADQGALIIAEGAYHRGGDVTSMLPGTYKFGIWHNTSDFDDVVDTDPAGDAVKREGNTGGYFIADQMVY